MENKMTAKSKNGVHSASNRETCRITTDLRIESIVSNEPLKKRLLKLLREREFCRFLSDAGAEVPHGLLLYGPAGCGKSFMAEAFAGSMAELTKQAVLRFSGDLSLDGSLSKLSDLTDAVIARGKCILILEDMDKMLEGGVGAGKSLLHQFVREIRSSEVYFIVTTTSRENLDTDLRRVFSLTEVIDIGYPTADETVEIMEHICNSFGFPWDFRSENEKNSGHGVTADVSDAAALCNEETFGTLRRMLSLALHHALSSKKEAMDISDLINGVESVRYQYCDEAFEMKPLLRKQHAYHEAGHILAAEILQPGIVAYSSIIRRGMTEGREGYVYFLHSWNKREDDVTDSLAAKAAVELVMGNSLNMGCDGDVTSAFKDLQRMVMYSGQYGLEYVELFDDFTKESQETRRKREERIYAIANQLYEKARSILCEHRDQLDQLADKLLKDGYLLASEIRAICHPEQDIVRKLNYPAAECA